MSSESYMYLFIYSLQKISKSIIIIPIYRWEQKDRGRWNTCLWYVATGRTRIWTKEIGSPSLVPHYSHLSLSHLPNDSALPARVPWPFNRSWVNMSCEPQLISPGASTTVRCQRIGRERLPLTNRTVWSEKRTPCTLW